MKLIKNKLNKNSISINLSIWKDKLKKLSTQHIYTFYNDMIHSFTSINNKAAFLTKSYEKLFFIFLNTNYIIFTKEIQTGIIFNKMY